MSGQTNLRTLLRTLTPVRQAGEYVFCTVEETAAPALALVLATFREAEGLTVVLRKETADQLGLPYDYVAAWITLTVHSSLAAVGLTAAFAQALAAENISCNVVAAYYHDHLFVALADAERALASLHQLAASS